MPSSGNPTILKQDSWLCVPRSLWVCRFTERSQDVDAGSGQLYRQLVSWSQQPAVKELAVKTAKALLKKLRRAKDNPLFGNPTILSQDSWLCVPRFL